MTEFPQMIPVRQRSDQPRVDDVEGEAVRLTASSRIRGRVGKGGRVAVAVGSRGIRNLSIVVRGVVKALRSMELDPFIVPAMGTHGGGTPEGQRQVLSDYGVRHETVGAPVFCELETVELGVNELGFPVYWNKRAFEADAVVAVNRVKAHTDFTGPYESGVLKMLVIGLGCRESPLQVHSLGAPGLARMLPASGRVVLEKTKFALGIALLENALEETASVVAVEPEDLLEVEPKLLIQAKQWMGRLPFHEADVLIVGELGKNYSGTGMDVNVIGRRMVEGENDFPSPKITRLAVLDVSAESHGNAVGVGLADLTTTRLVRSIDHNALRLNTLTARFLQRSRIPFDFATDRQVIRTSLETCWRPRIDQARMAIIPNTLEVADLFVTKPLAEELDSTGRTIELGPPRELPFLPDDRLDQKGLFPHSNQARRSAESQPVHANHK